MKIHLFRKRERQKKKKAEKKQNEEFYHTLPYKQVNKRQVYKQYPNPQSRIKSNKMTKATYYFDWFSIECIERYSERMGISKGEFVRRAITFYVAYLKTMRIGK